jgi:outer membrane lipoprotein-sorting protein
MERSIALNKNFNPGSRNSLVKRVLAGLTVKVLFYVVIALSYSTLLPPESRAQPGPERDRILATIGRIEDAYRGLQSYECDIEGIYFDSGRESQRYDYRFYFRKPNRFRIEFRRPYADLTIFYTQGEREFVAMPFPKFPSIQFRFSVDNPLFRTPSGQRMNQLNLFDFLEFLRQNASTIPQEKPDFINSGVNLSFWVTSEDYATSGARIRYRLQIDTRVWLPDRIERYDAAGTPREFTTFRNFIVNPVLSEAFFNSGYKDPSSTPSTEPGRP